MGFAFSNPDMPAMSQEEQNLLAKNTELFDLYVKAMGSQSAENATYSEIMKGVSGLYDTVQGEDKTVFNSQPLEAIKEKINAYKNQPLEPLRDKEIPGWALDELGKMGYDVNRTMADHNQTKGGRGDRKDPAQIFQRFIDSVQADPARWGSYGAATIEKGGVSYALNQNAVAALRDKVQKISDLQFQRAQAGLSGTLPVSAGTQQAKAREFGILKENAARRGIRIMGDSPETATSDSTTGNEILRGFNSRYGLVEGQERSGDLAAFSTFNPGALPTGYVGASNASGPASAASMIPAAIGASSAIIQPYSNQRYMGYQADLLDTQTKRQVLSDLLGLGTTAVTAGIL